MEPAEREAVGIRVMLEVARAFRDGRPAQSAETLAERLGSSLRVVTDLLVRFRDAGIVSTAGPGASETAFQLGRPAESVQVGDVLSAIRGRRLDAPAAREGDDAVRDTVRETESVLGQAEAALAPVRQQTLASLLERLPRQTG
jgi:DNA-binding IscR family transcriptional regulator